MDSSYHVLLDVLTKASSQDVELLKVAEGQLKSWESQPGFYPALVMIVCDKSLAVNVRWLSILCVKNGIDHHWRSFIPSEEKYAIKCKLLQCLNEPVNQIALQLAVVVAKVARYEFPNNWQELFPALINGIQSSDQLYQLRSFLTMHHVIKILASKRLVNDQLAYRQLAETIFSDILHLWIEFSKIFLQDVENGAQKSNESLQRSLLTLKILRNLVVYGFKDFYADSNAVNFVSLIYQQFKPFLECRALLRNRCNSSEMCEKYLSVLVKTLYDILDFHPYSFIKFIRPTLECCITFCFHKQFEGSIFERFIFQCMNLIKEIISSNHYVKKKVKNIREETTDEALVAINEVLASHVLNEMCRQLLSKYLLLTRDDISLWESNPEEYAFEEYGNSGKYSIRQCAKDLLQELLRRFQVADVVFQMSQSLLSSAATDFNDILQKEAVYYALGISAFHIYAIFDFETWLPELISELQKKDTGCYIIRRRVIWFIAQWMTWNSGSKPVVYEVIIQLLMSDDNLLVRLEAANALKIIDEFQFVEQQFLPFLEQCIASLFRLLGEVNECDLKMFVLHILSLVIDRMRSEVCPYVDSLLQYLPLLWTQSEEHYMLKCAIVSCSVCLVKSLGSLSESIHSKLFPWIDVCTDVSQPPHVYLIEDGLELWWAVLENASKYSPELLNLAINLFPLLEYNSENFRKVVELIEGYVILCGEEFLKKFGQELVKSIMSSMTDMKTEGLVTLLRMIETVFLAFPEQGIFLFQPMLSFCLSEEPKDDHVMTLKTLRFSLISRVILHNQQVFGSMIHEQAQKCHTDVNTVLSNLLKSWVDDISMMHPTHKRKLMGLALSCLITSSSEVVHDHICGVFYCIVDILNDIISSSEDDPPFSDLLVMNPSNFIEDGVYDDSTEHEKRRFELFKKDPVYNVALRDYFYNQVMALKQSVGDAKFQDMMSTVDSETMEQVLEYLQNK